MERKKRFILLGVIGLSLLAACGKETEQAQEEQTQAEEDFDYSWVSEQTEYEGFTQEEITEKAVSWEALFSGYDTVLQDTYENFRLPESVTISPATLYKQVEIVRESDFTENAEEIFRWFLGDVTTEEPAFDDIETMGQATWIMDSEEEKVYCAVMDCGFVSVVKPSGYEIRFNGNFEVADIVHIDRGEPLSQSYALLDGEESIQEAVSYIEEWMNQNWIMWEPDFTYSVKTVEVRRYKDNYIYDFHVEKFFDGIPLDDDIGYTGMEMDTYGNLKLKYVGSDIYIRMCNRNSIDVFSNLTGILRVQSVEEEKEGWLSLSDCAHMLEQLFSEYVVYEISDIEMQYVLCPDYASINAEVKHYSYMQPGMRILAKPVWCFVMDIPEEKLLNEDGSFTAGYQKHYIDVDMRTGEVWLELE
ncbi:MAG: hypothetical protein HDR14_01880 [Lachnospiraceae bacterium]|nr:hypothetical protein [Lachnospiraceae bacterium]